MSTHTEETVRPGDVGALLTTAEVAARLRVEPQTVRLWIQTKNLPAVRLGNKPRAPIRFRPRELEAWIAQQQEAVVIGTEKRKKPKPATVEAGLQELDGRDMELRRRWREASAESHVLQQRAAEARRAVDAEIGGAAVAGRKAATTALEEALAAAQRAQREDSVIHNALATAIKDAEAAAMRYIGENATAYRAALDVHADNLAEQARMIAKLQAQLDADTKTLKAKWERAATACGEFDTLHREPMSGDVILDERFRPKYRGGTTHHVA